VSNAGAHVMGATTYAVMARLRARLLRAVRQADERDPQGRVLGFARVHDWGETTIVAGDLAEAITRLKQETLRQIPARPWRGTFARSLSRPA
jgi:hypothetical protein